MSKPSRKDITSKLTLAATYYWTKKLFSSYVELGICSKQIGTLRADIISFNMKGEVVITEVKSGWSDFKSDTKWNKYLDYCNKMYFCVPCDLWENKNSEILEAISDTGVGVMILCPNKGRLKVVKNAKSSNLKKKRREWLITKLAWAGGISKKNQKRTSKIYL